MFYSNFMLVKQGSHLLKQADENVLPLTYSLCSKHANITQNKFITI